MSMHFEWWHWALLGIGLILAELALPVFVAIWFGLGALAVAVLLACWPALSLTAQLAVWLVVATTMLAYWFKIYRRERPATLSGRSDSGLVGEMGLLTRAVAPYQPGAVRLQKPMLGSDVWPCIADIEISAGERVVVLALKGSLLKVGKAASRKITESQEGASHGAR